MAGAWPDGGQRSNGMAGSSGHTVTSALWAGIPLRGHPVAADGWIVEPGDHETTLGRHSLDDADPRATAVTG